MAARLYIGRLASDVRERDIERFLKGYGRVNEILLKNGYGFVEFDDPRDADDVCYELNGKELLRQRVVIEHARGPGSRPPPRDSRDGRSSRASRPIWLDKYGPPTRTDYRVIVENVSSRVSWQDLKDYMRTAGDVSYADAHRTRRGEGTVEFSSHSDMKRAIERLDDTELNGRRIRVVEDRPKSRRRSRSGSRGGRRSRSRSGRGRSRSRSRSGRRRSPTASRSRSRSRSRDRSASPKRRSKDRSASPRRSRERSRSREKSRERSASKGRSAERDRVDEKEKDRRSGSREKSKGRADSRDRSRSGSRRGSRSRERSGSRNMDHDGRDGKASPERQNEADGERGDE